MSIRAIPLIILAFFLYNAVIFLGGGAPAETVLTRPLFSIPLVGKSVIFNWGDLIILFTISMLFVEIVKSTYTSSTSLLDHAFSMMVFIACLVEFLLYPQAATGVFFNLTVATLVDVVAGYTIGIRVARRDLSIGSDQ